MSRVAEVIKNKNRVEKLRQKRQREEIRMLKDSAKFKAQLHSELKKIDVLLDSPEIRHLVIAVPNEYMNSFGAALYGSDLAEYEIRQVENEPNKFTIKKRLLIF